MAYYDDDFYFKPKINYIFPDDKIKKIQKYDMYDKIINKIPADEYNKTIYYNDYLKADGFNSVMEKIQNNRRRWQLINSIQNTQKLRDVLDILSISSEFFDSFIKWLSEDPISFEAFLSTLLLPYNQNNSQKFIMLLTKNIATLRFITSKFNSASQVQKLINLMLQDSAQIVKDYLDSINKLPQQPQVNIPPVAPTPVAPPKPQPPQSPTITPKKIDEVTNLWSPVSYKGKVYKFNRGVVGIDKNGQKIEIVFDGTSRHHNEATAEIGIRTNCSVSDRYNNPFVLGMEVGKQGTIILQLEGDSLLVYLPETINRKQYESLLSEIIPRRSFSTVAYTHGDDIYDAPEIDAANLEAFCADITTSYERTGR